MGTTAGKALAFSVGGFKSKAATAQALKDRVPLISPAGGLVLSMPDPVGIASDLAILMRDQASDFAKPPLTMAPEASRKCAKQAPAQ